jgi:phage gp36-like protein
MRYINRDDLIALIQEPLLNSSIVGADGQIDETILDSIEQNAIDLAKGYLTGRYDTDKIFDIPPIRNGILAQAISMIVIYRAVRRNAARKVSEDFNSFYTDAIAMLSSIQTEELPLEGVPVPDITVPLLYGNTTNTDFFI